MDDDAGGQSYGSLLIIDNSIWCCFEEVIVRWNEQIVGNSIVWVNK